MKMKEFYEKYNLNKYYFAEMAHVGSKTLLKYDEGKPIREESRLRIEKAIRLVVQNDLKRPKYPGYNRFWGRNFEWDRNNREYFKNFQKLLSEEES